MCLFHRGMYEIVGKENVRDGIIIYISDDILGEIAAVNHMNLLKRTEQIAGQGIAVAVFQNHETPAVTGRCAYGHGLGVATLDVA